MITTYGLDHPNTPTVQATSFHIFHLSTGERYSNLTGKDARLVSVYCGDIFKYKFQPPRFMRGLQLVDGMWHVADDLPRGAPAPTPWLTQTVHNAELNTNFCMGDTCAPCSTMQVNTVATANALKESNRLPHMVTHTLGVYHNTVGRNKTLRVPLSKLSDI